MQVLTTRFGPVHAAAPDRVKFLTGLIGVPQLRHFVLLRDPEVPSLSWLQSTRDPAWALALLGPRSIEPAYQVRASRQQLQPIQATDGRDVDVYVVLNQTVEFAIANLQAPILINRRRSLGVQLVLSDARYAVRHPVNLRAAFRKSA